MTTEKEIESLRLIMLNLAVITQNLMYSTLSDPLSSEKFTQVCILHNSCDRALGDLTFLASRISLLQIDHFMNEWLELAGSTQSFLENINISV